MGAVLAVHAEPPPGSPLFVPASLLSLCSIQAAFPSPGSPHWRSVQPSIPGTSRSVQYTPLLIEGVGVLAGIGDMCAKRLSVNMLLVARGRGPPRLALAKIS